MSDEVVAVGTQVDNSLGVVNYDAGTSTWPVRPVGDSRRFMWIGPTAPPIGGDYMTDGWDLFTNTAPGS